LLHGEADLRSSLNVAEDIHAKIPTSKLVTISGAGHEISLETPESFNAEVRSFLRANPK
jgi:pimeloyl-ACP methyl ester carboxylesterase